MDCWQRDLIVSNVKLAEMATPDDQPRAAAHYRTALAIARDLASTNRLAPVDAWMPRKLERRLRAVSDWLPASFTTMPPHRAAPAAGSPVRRGTSSTIRDFAMQKQRKRKPPALPPHSGRGRLVV